MKNEQPDIANMPVVKESVQPFWRSSRAFLAYGTVACVAAAGVWIGGLSSNETEQTIFEIDPTSEVVSPASPELPSQKDYQPPTVDYNRGKAVVHFIDLNNTVPLTTMQRSAVLGSVKTSFKLLHDASDGVYKELPVVEGQSIKLDEAPSVQEVCADASDSVSTDSALHFEARENPAVAAAPGDLSISVLNLDMQQCPGGAAATAFTTTYIGINSGAVVAQGQADGVIAHEIHHNGPMAGTQYGHNSLLSECDLPESPSSKHIIDPEACESVSSYGNEGTIAGNAPLEPNLVRDPDLFTGFEEKRMDMLAEGEVAVVTNTQTIRLESLAGTSDGVKLIRIPVDGVTLSAVNNMENMDTVTPTAMYIDLSQQPLPYGNEVVNEPGVTTYLVDEASKRPSTYTLPLRGEFGRYSIVQASAASYRIKLGSKILGVTVDSMRVGHQVGDAEATVRLTVAE